jgi:hypothetical protein
MIKRKIKVIEVTNYVTKSRKCVRTYEKQLFKIEILE